MRGAQAAIFLSSYDDFADYSHLESEIAENIERVLRKVKPFEGNAQRHHNAIEKGSCESANTGPSNLLDLLVSHGEQVGINKSAIGEDYEG